MEQYKKLHYQSIQNFYKLWEDYYDEICHDPDWNNEHIEPDRKLFTNLSDFECETIRRMAMTKMGRAFQLGV